MSDDGTPLKTGDHHITHHPESTVDHPHYVATLKDSSLLGAAGSCSSPQCPEGADAKKICNTTGQSNLGMCIYNNYNGSTGTIYCSGAEHGDTLDVKCPIAPDRPANEKPISCPCAPFITPTPAPATPTPAIYQWDCTAGGGGGCSQSVDCCGCHYKNEKECKDSHACDASPTPASPPASPTPASPPASPTCIGKNCLDLFPSAGNCFECGEGGYANRKCGLPNQQYWFPYDTGGATYQCVSNPEYPGYNCAAPSDGAIGQQLCTPP